jgi:polyisoprenyl-teichoic acid--peptidoglycan teichoic acid transferase
VSEGGAGLAMATAEQLLGIPVDYYALVNFNLFVHFIDEIGGVKIDVPEGVRISIIDGKNKFVSPGVQTMAGEVALAYVRARTTPGGEFDRIQRQQLVFMGIRNRILELDLLTTLIARAPLIYGEFSDGVRTNLTPNDIFKLVVALQGIPDANIFSITINPDDVIFGSSPEGLDVLLPIPERIRLARDEVFPIKNPLSPAQTDKPIQQLVAEEGANIAVLNGTITPGLAAQTSEYLESENLNITLIDIADEVYKNTTLIDNTGNPYTVQFLVSLMNIGPTHIFHNYNPKSNIDIEITLGEDWVQSGDLP